jgi:Skp family chaperone for outer membrane proteins
MNSFNTTINKGRALFNHLSIDRIRALFLTGIFSVVAGTAPVLADIRVGTVDMTKVLQESPSAKAKVDAIDKKATQAKAKINKQKEDLAALQKKLGDDASGTSPDAEKFRKASRELQRYVRDTEEELKTELMEVRKTVTEQAFKKVTEVAKSKNLDIVLEKSEVARGPVLFAEGVTDITSTVLASMKN